MLPVGYFSNGCAWSVIIAVGGSLTPTPAPVRHSASNFHTVAYPVFIPGICYGEPPQKTYNPPPNGSQIACSKSVFRPGHAMSYKYMRKLSCGRQNTGNYSSLSSQKDARLCLKCSKTHLAAWLCPDPLGSPNALPRTSYSRNGGLLLRDINGGKDGKGIPKSHGE